MGIVLPEGIFNNPSLLYVREFCEDNAFVRAVVSLPENTFHSAGASVKASLLFLQKFTEAEKKDYDDKKHKAKLKIDAKYEPNILQRTAQYLAELEAARKNRDAEARKAIQGEFRKFQSEIREAKRNDSRRLLKEWFDYPIFLYDAKHIGITATGEQDTCELYYSQSLGLPQGMASEQTALAQYT